MSKVFHIGEKYIDIDQRLPQEIYYVAHLVRRHMSWKILQGPASNKRRKRLEKLPGQMDMRQCIYLPCLQVFVTDDENLQAMMKHIMRVVRLRDVDVCGYDAFRDASVCWLGQQSASVE
jgi:hypothetical protein